MSPANLEDGGGGFGSLDWFRNWFLFRSSGVLLHFLPACLLAVELNCLATNEIIC